MFIRENKSSLCLDMFIAYGTCLLVAVVCVLKLLLMAKLGYATTNDHWLPTENHTHHLRHRSFDRRRRILAMKSRFNHRENPKVQKLLF